ncbi:unnamed protein product [Ectocarpus sp. 6 AP-2014]
MTRRRTTLLALLLGWCAVDASAKGVVQALAGLVVGVVAGRFSQRVPRLRPTGSADEPRRPLFEAEGWEGEADVSDWEPFRLLGRSMVDYIADYYQRVESLPVRAIVEPGYLKKRLTQREFPTKGEVWSDIMADVESHIMPGITHWQHPSFFAWYPAASSPPAILGDMLASMFNVIGFSWEASPASTELETVVLDQLGRAVDLPEAFLSSGGSGGGGVIQGSASESTLVAVLAARTRALKHMRRRSPAGVSDSELLAKMTLYASDQAHSSVQKAANIAGLGSNLRLIPTRGSGEDGQRCYTLDAGELSEAMRKDEAAGLTPVFVSANVGSTNTCAVDPVRSLGEACRSFSTGESKKEEGSEKLVPWLHVDAASAYLVDALSVTPEILRSKEYNSNQVSDFRDWQVPLGRKFRSLKIWLTMRAFGLEKVRGLIRRHTQLAGEFEAMVEQDDRFEIVAPARFGLVCFRLKASCAANEELRQAPSGLAFFSSTKLEGRTCLRVSVGGPATEMRHIRDLWCALGRTADAITADGF